MVFSRLLWTSTSFYDSVLLAEGTTILKGASMMRIRTREAICMGICILAGITLCGPAAQAATETLTAIRSAQPIYVDGVQVSITAYSINGSNYVKLRDVGKAVGFNVFWDGSSVQIESDQPYTGKAPANQTEQQPTAVLTEESVQAAIRALRDTYPTNTYYGSFYRSTSKGPYGAAPTACAGWATLCSDAAFGDLPWSRVNNPSWEDIRPGDLIRYDNASGGHVVVVLEKTDEYVVVTESGTNNKARWGGQYFRWWLEEQPGYACFTRSPQ